MDVVVVLPAEALLVIAEGYVLNDELVEFFDVGNLFIQLLKIFKLVQQFPNIV